MRNSLGPNYETLKTTLVMSAITARTLTVICSVQIVTNCWCFTIMGIRFAFIQVLTRFSITFWRLLTDAEESLKDQFSVRAKPCKLSCNPSCNAMPAAMQCQLQHNAVPDTRRLVFESHFLNSLLHTNIFHFRKSHFWSNVCMILARHIFSIYLFRIQRNSDRHIFHGRCKHLPYQGFLGLSLEGRESRLVTPERHLDILNARY